MTLFDFFKPRGAAAPAAPEVDDQARQQNDTVVDAVLMSGVVLPPYPVLLEELDHLMARDDFELGSLVDVVNKDPSLTAALLRVANSPVFGLRQSISSLRQAITVLGLARTRAVLSSEVLRDALRGYGDMALIQALWRRFSEIANLCAGLASRANSLKALADLAYSAGIFHGTGCFILVKRFPKETHGLASAGTGFEAQMQQLDRSFGTDHAAIGAMVARGWRLPREVSEAIAQQHRPRQPLEAPGPAERLASILRLAILLHDNGVDPASWPAATESAREELGLDAETLKEILEEFAASAGTPPPA